MYAFLLFLSVVSAVPERYFLGSMPALLESLLITNDQPGDGPVNDKSLYTLVTDRYVYGEPREPDIKVYSANAWNKLTGIRCPEHYHHYALDHHLFSEMYMCVHVPSPLPKPHTVYKISQNGKIFSTICDRLKYTYQVKLIDYENLRLVKRNNGSWYLSSDYCLSTMYSVDSKGIEMFLVNYTVSDQNVYIHVPPAECYPWVEIHPEPIDPVIGLYLPLIGEVEASTRLHECATKSHSYTPYDSSAGVGVRELPLSDNMNMIWRVDVGNHQFPSNLYSLWDRKINSTYIWSSVNYVQYPDPVVYHAAATASSSPFRIISTIIIAVIRPVIDVILDSLMYVFDSLLDIFHSSEFMEIFDRLLSFFLLLFKSILSFIYTVLIPKLNQGFMSIPFKYKFLSFVCLFLYLRTTKLLFSVCVCAILSAFLKDK
nr:MAG: ORF2 [Dezidougou virus]